MLATPLQIFKFKVTGTICLSYFQFVIYKYSRTYPLGHLYSGDTKFCLGKTSTYNLCICYLYWTDTSIQVAFVLFSEHYSSLHWCHVSHTKKGSLKVFFSVLLSSLVYNALILSRTYHPILCISRCELFVMSQAFSYQSDSVFNVIAKAVFTIHSDIRGENEEQGGRARVVQCMVHIPASTPFLGWVCCSFSPLLRDVFLQVLRFSPLLKNQHFQIPIRPGIR